MGILVSLALASALMKSELSAFIPGVKPFILEPGLVFLLGLAFSSGLTFSLYLHLQLHKSFIISAKSKALPPKIPKIFSKNPSSSVRVLVTVMTSLEVAICGLGVGDEYGRIDVGNEVGFENGEVVGDVVGNCVGSVVGDVVGPDVGIVVGEAVGKLVGEVVGLVVGSAVGTVVGGRVYLHK